MPSRVAHRYAVVCRLMRDSPEDLAVMAENSPAFDADVPKFTDIQPIFDVREIVI